MQNVSTVPNYTLHVPAHLQHVILAGLASGVIGIALIILAAELRVLAYGLLAFAIFVGVSSFLLQRIITLPGRLRARNLIVQSVAWKGDEQVLDVGCGNGIMTMAVARQLKTGKVTGVDIWDTTAGRQTAQIFWHNAQAEGVKDRVEVIETDARKMPFENQTFDVIVSSLALHHMGGMDDSLQTVGEMMRVLKPGGAILLYDMFPFTNAAAKRMGQAGWRVTRLDGVFIQTWKMEKVL